MKSYIDLHLHSTFSDGQFNLTQLVEKAEKNNVKIISVTDHDDIRSAKEMKKIKDLNLTNINGVELSSIVNIDEKKQRIHILGYGYDENNKHLINTLDNKKHMRNEINEKYLLDMLKKFKYLNTDILKKIETDKYIQLHKLIIKYLKENKYTLDQSEEIKKYLNANKVNYPNYEFTEEAAIKIILEAGGIPVLAHPYQYNLNVEQEDRLLKHLKKIGLIGVEIYHSGETKHGMKVQKDLCTKNELEWSVGSDYHTDYDDFGNEIGLGKNKNLCITDCPLIKVLKK